MLAMFRWTQETWSVFNWHQLWNCHTYSCVVYLIKRLRRKNNVLNGSDATDGHIHCQTVKVQCLTVKNMGLCCVLPQPHLSVLVLMCSRFALDQRVNGVQYTLKPTFLPVTFLFSHVCGGFYSFRSLL